MGMLANVMKKNAIIVQKPSSTVAVRVDMTAIQRKAYDAFLYIVREELRKDSKKRKFAILFDDLKEIFGVTASKDNAYYKENVKELMTKVAEYNVLGKSKKVEGAFVLMSRVEFVEDLNTREIVCNFEVPEFVIDLIKDPKSPYANINLVVIRGLKSKYAIILYELVKDYVSDKSEIPEMTMEEFRKVFGIETKYKAIKDLRKYVLEPAVSELNNSEAIDFIVEYQLKRAGKRYRYIKFFVKPKPQKLKVEQQIENYKSLAENKDLRELLFLVPEQYRKRKNCVNLLLGALEEKGKDYVKAQIEYTNQRAPKNYLGYLKNALEKDYASVEELDIELAEEQDWKKRLIGKKVSLKGKQGLWMLAHIGEQDVNGNYEVRFDSIENPGRVEWYIVAEEKLKRLAGVKEAT